jgi:hypothetical protein
MSRQGVALSAGARCGDEPCLFTDCAKLRGSSGRNNPCFTGSHHGGTTRVPGRRSLEIWE